MFLKKAVYDLKNIRWYVLVPLAVEWVVLPFICWYMISRFPPELTIANTLSQAQIFMPIMAAFPVIFILRSYIENDGHEVLYIYGSVKNTGFLTVLCVYVLYALVLAPVFVWFFSIYGPLWYELFRTLVQAFFFLSLAYLLVYLVRSTLIAFMGTIIFGAIMLFAVQADGGGGFFRQYGLFAAITDMNPQPYEPEKYLIVLGVSILLFIAGIILNRRYFH